MEKSELTGRVFLAGRDVCGVFTESGEMFARLSGGLRHRTASPSDMPVVGDYVRVENGIIRSILPRASLFVRRAAGRRHEQQVLAANVDVAFLVCGLDGDYNLRRLERYLVLVRESGASAVIVLNKSDLRPDAVAGAIADCRCIAGRVPVVPASTRTPGGLDELMSFLVRGKTVVLLGSSGAGKSTIANRLAGHDLLRTNAVRESDSRGRHTTTHRELIPLPSGAFLIDTPGLREIQLWAEEESVESTFDEIRELAENCRFSDCSHGHEPGCAVQAAVEAGDIDAGRWNSYQKLAAEVRHLHKKTIRRLSRQMRQYKQSW